jgi:biopolymer transport protein ExbD
MAMKRPEKDEVEIPSSSLADIAFLLLIFFLVCTTIDVDKGFRLALPPKTGDIVKIPMTKVLINDAGKVLLDQKEIEIRDIERIIRDKIAQNDSLVVSLKTTRNTKYEVYIRVLDQLKRANATRISIAEPEKT